MASQILGLRFSLQFFPNKKEDKDKVILPKEDLQKGILRETEGQNNEGLAVRCATKCQNDAFLRIFIMAFDISRS